jgi:hypothetical protein
MSDMTDEINQVDVRDRENTTELTSDPLASLWVLDGGT